MTTNFSGEVVVFRAQLRFRYVALKLLHTRYLRDVACFVTVKSAQIGRHRLHRCSRVDIEALLFYLEPVAGTDTLLMLRELQKFIRHQSSAGSASPNCIHSDVQHWFKPVLSWFASARI